MTAGPAERLRVVVTTPLEPELVEGLRRRHPDVDVVVPARLLGPARYPAHHPFPELGDRPEARREWDALLDAADVLLDFGPAELQPTLAARPRLRWIQATSAGVGQLVARIGLADHELPVVTTASGVHAGPLAEFALLGILWFTKGGPHLLRQQRAHRWERHATLELAGRTLVVVGMGRIGSAVATAGRSLGLRVIGCVRRPRPESDAADALVVPVAELDRWLPEADAVVLSCPLTPQTHHLIDARRLTLLPRGAIIVNVSRGPCIDEAALVSALQDGRVGGAALDVAEEEPLPPSSPLWDMPQVLISPHSASTVAVENARIVAIFEDNLGRFQRGEPLRNQLDKRAGY